MLLLDDSDDQWFIFYSATNDDVVDEASVTAHTDLLTYFLTYFLT